jgi:ribosomal-protein-alanine N-acetyltransferase
VTLQHGEVTLRPLRYRDARAWRAVRRRNAAWLQPWDATVPPGGGERPATFRTLVARLSRQARQGLGMPFVVEVDGRFVGQVTVNNILRGSAQFASVGYWLDRDVAGRGIMPTAVALAVDHCFLVLRLHRIEVNIRPENAASLRVVEKLGFRDEGLRRGYLHIAGQWRDHRTFALTADEVPEGMLTRWRSQQSPRP